MCRRKPNASWMGRSMVLRSGSSRPGGGGGGAAALPAYRRDQPDCTSSRHARGSVRQIRVAGCDRAICIAPPLAALGATGRVRSGSVSAGDEKCNSSFCLSAFRCRSEDLHWRLLCAAGGNHRSCRSHPTVRPEAHAQCQSLARAEDHLASGNWPADAGGLKGRQTGAIVLAPICGMNSKGSPAGGEPLRRRIFCARRLDYACTKMLDSSFALDRIGGFSRKLQYARVLISYQQIEENPGPVRKAERVMVLRLALKVYFAELCHTERHGIRPEPFPAISDIFLESELRSRKKAHGDVHLCRVGKTACAGSPKISRYKSFAQLGGARRHSVQTIVAHASSYCWTQLPS